MTIGLTYPEFEALSPCADSKRRVVRLLGGAKAWNGNSISAAAAREAGATFEDIVWAASAVARNDKDVERRIRLWVADCAARVLHIFEKERPRDDRPRLAIIASRQFARGEIGDAAWAAARDAAWAARDAARDAEETWQFDRLIMWLSEDEPQDWPLSEPANVEAA